MNTIQTINNMKGAARYEIRRGSTVLTIFYANNLREAQHYVQRYCDTEPSLYCLTAPEIELFCSIPPLYPIGLKIDDWSKELVGFYVPYTGKWQLLEDNV